MGHQYSLLIPAPLKSLFASLEGVDVLLTPNEPLEALVWDCWTSMMSLPYHFATNQDTIPASIPYLKAPALKPPSPKAEPPATRELDMTLRVGLVWRGSPGFMNDAERSLPSLETLAPLSHIEGVTFYSLQRDDPKPTTVDLDPRFRTGEGKREINDFGDSARIIETLDVVIGVDTAVIHLAAALGKRTWVLLSARLPDWRWLNERSDSPWYPVVVKLFRQTTHGDWRAVVRNVSGELRSASSEKFK